MRIFSSQALHEIDTATCKAQQIDSVELMERAANAVTVEIVARFTPVKRIVIIAGPGNNGGDALAVARMLHDQGYKNLEIFLFNIRGKISHDCNIERSRLLATEGIDFTEVTRDFTPPYLTRDDVVIDGLFGSGLNHPLSGGFQSLARLINDSGAYVISIDSPSGLFGEWNETLQRRDMIHANLTLTFQTPRLSFFFEENADVVGEWKLLDIDLDPDSMKNTPTDFTLVEERNIRPLIRKRLKFSAKRDYGSAMLFCGSIGMMGAAVLAARATLKSGAGLVTVHSARAGLGIVQTAVPEAMFEPDRNERFISDMTLHHDHQAVAVGSGIGCNDNTINALEGLLKTCKNPLVLDADALNCISRRPALLTMLPPQTIITPHAGEFDRLFGEHPNSEARLKKAIEMAKYYNIIIVLKSHHTMTVRPTGKVYFNSTGNPGMATAGSGDVLTGVIAGFLAQGYLPEYASLIGVYMHGLAGDMAAAEFGEFGMTAGNIADYVGRAVRKVLNPTDMFNDK